MLNCHIGKWLGQRRSPTASWSLHWHSGLCRFPAARQANMSACARYLSHDTGCYWTVALPPVHALLTYWSWAKGDVASLYLGAYPRCSGSDRQKPSGIGLQHAVYRLVNLYLKNKPLEYQHFSQKGFRIRFGSPSFLCSSLRFLNISFYDTPQNPSLIIKTPIS